MIFVLLFLAVTLVEGLEDAGWEGATDGLGRRIYVTFMTEALWRCRSR